VLEEVEVTPLLVGAVVDRAASPCTLGTGEATPALKVEIEVETVSSRVELKLLHSPWRRQAESKLEQGTGGVFHGEASWVSLIPPGCLNPLDSARSHFHR